MVKFSIRNGILSEKIIVNGDNVPLKHRLWTLFYQSAYEPFDSVEPELTDIEKVKTLLFFQCKIE